MKRALVFALGLGLIEVAWPLAADEALKPPAQTSSTTRVDFVPDGVIRVNGSYDDLYVEGWNQPEVEISTTKFMRFEYKPAHPEHATRHLEAVRVEIQRSAGQLDISIQLPRRDVRLPLLPHTTNGGVRLECHVRVPRKSRLMIRHGAGIVSISDVTGDIDAHCRRGDIVLWLPGTGAYLIDATTKLGKVSSDLTGKTHSRFFVGQKFVSVSAAPLQRIHLHTGFGGVTIKPILPESQANGAAQQDTREEPGLHLR